jgi:hypothetical protein
MKPGYADWNSINSLAVAQKGKPAVYINNGLSFDDNDSHIWECVMESLKPKMDKNEFLNLLSDLIHGGLFFFDTMEEAQEFLNIFNQNVVYASPIYAQLYDATGMGLTENT